MMLQQLFTAFSGFASIAGDCEHGHDFFGLVSWYHYLPDSDFGVTLNGQVSKCAINNNFQFLGSSSDLPLIALAVVDDLLRIAGLVAVGYVIYGGVRYISSQGNPEGVAAAQRTVLNALIGLAIAIVAIAFVSFLGNSLMH